MATLQTAKKTSAPFCTKDVTIQKSKAGLPLATYTEFHISVKGPKGSYAALWRSVHTFEELLTKSIATYSQLSKQSPADKRLVITIR